MSFINVTLACFFSFYLIPLYSFWTSKNISLRYCLLKLCFKIGTYIIKKKKQNKRKWIFWKWRIWTNKNGSFTEWKDERKFIGSYSDTEIVCTAQIYQKTPELICWKKTFVHTVCLNWFRSRKQRGSGFTMFRNVIRQCSANVIVITECFVNR